MHDTVLTTSAEALHRTHFPNPDSPLMAGKVGFEGDFTMTNDGAEFWNSQTAPGPYGGQQNGPAFCWVDGGRRHARGTWTKPKGADPFFSGPRDSGTKSIS